MAAIAPRPDKDELRIEKLKSYLVLDTEAESQFDRLTSLAAMICKTPIALVSLLDDSRQWFKSRIGLDACETPRDISFCQFAIHQDQFFEIEDAAEDERFFDNPLVTGSPFIRYYGGQPLITPDNFRLGTICVIDTEPKTLSMQQKEAMGILAHEIVMHLELRIKTIQLEKARELERRRAQDLLIQSGKLASLGQLIASVTHEIQNPLWNLDLALQNHSSENKSLHEFWDGLKGSIKLSDEDSRWLENFLDKNQKNNAIMSRGLQSLTGLCQALKTQSHPDQKPSYNVKIIDVLSDALTITQGKLIEHEVTKEIPELPLCCCHRSRLGQVFINILSNAADALDEKKATEELKGREYQGQINIEAEPCAQDGVAGINVTFNDNGPGIDPAIQSHVFTEFFTTKSPGKGTGLGLSLSKRIIDAHGGHISISSSKLGGAKFTVWIPLEVSEKKPDAKSPEL